MMTIYIEYVIIDNVIIDYLMLKATFVLMGIPSRKGRLFLCAFLGAIIALIYPMLKFSDIILTAVKIMSGILIVLLSANFKSVKNFYISVIMFFSFNFLTGGAIIGIFNLFNIPLSTEICVATIIFPAYLILKFINCVIKYIFNKKHVVDFTYEVQLCFNDKKILAKGFLDTGNTLFYENSPVIVCNKTFIKNFLCEQLLKVKFKKINVRTAIGIRQNTCFKLDRIILYIGDKHHIFNNVVVCIAKIKSDDYDVILHPAFFKEVNEYEDDKFAQKVC